VRELVRLGADVRRVSAAGSPLLVHYYDLQRDTVFVLISCSDVDLDAVDKDGNSIAHHVRPAILPLLSISINLSLSLSLMLSRLR
jgi:hypothetical protein